MNRPIAPNAALPYALYRAAQVRELERAAIEQYGIAGIDLMNRAGAAAYACLRARWPEATGVTVLAGLGNNGGDGYAIARLARADGLAVRVLQLGDPGRLRGDAAQALADYGATGGEIAPLGGAEGGLPRRPGVLVDALLGIGLDRPVEGELAATIAAVNAARAAVLAVDIPSGLHADTGAVLGAAVRADLTVTFIGLKQGLFTADGPQHCGEIRFAALRAPAAVYGRTVLAARRVDWVRQSQTRARRSRTAHKGDFGHVLAIGGAPGMSGAVRLAGEAALRAGAGLTTIATHPAHAAWLNLTRPELMVAGVADAAALEPPIDRADVIAIGPGLDRGPWGRALWSRVRTLDKPLIVDADALNLLAEEPGRGPDWVLTPHPGEAARLLGCTIPEVAADRFGAVREIQSRYGGVAVLKGAGTLIQGPSPRPPAVCSDGNPGMATAGCGDVLTGILAALRAQGRGLACDAEEAACTAVCLHAAAGDRAARAGEQGMLAGDLLDCLRAVANAIPTEMPWTS